MALTRGVRFGLALWVVLAIAGWNLIFDRIVVLAGRGYVSAAATAAEASRPYLLINDSMHPAVTGAVRTATAISGPVFIVGLALIGLVGRRSSPRNPEP